MGERFSGFVVKWRFKVNIKTNIICIKGDELRKKIKKQKQEHGQIKVQLNDNVIAFTVFGSSEVN